MSDDPSTRALRVGLTGGIASGKSSAAAEFARLGVPVIDADEIGREVTAPGAPVLAKLAALRPDEPLVRGGELDRRRLRALMFRDDALRSRVEALLHPRILALIRERVQAVDAPYAVLVIPLLDESHLGSVVDRVLVVDVPESTQVERLVRRDRETEPDARRMLAAQMSRASRLALADELIDNSASPAELKAQVEALDQYYRKLGTRDSGTGDR
jgi:dephospho-CoA kinase